MKMVNTKVLSTLTLMCSKSFAANEASFDNGYQTRGFAFDDVTQTGGDSSCQTVAFDDASCCGTVAFGDSVGCQTTALGAPMQTMAFGAPLMRRRRKKAPTKFVSIPESVTEDHATPAKLPDKLHSIDLGSCATAMAIEPETPKRSTTRRLEKEMQHQLTDDEQYHAQTQTMLDETCALTQTMQHNETNTRYKFVMRILPVDGISAQPVEKVMLKNCSLGDDVHFGRSESKSKYPHMSGVARRKDGTTKCHFKATIEENFVSVMDCGSLNGTYIVGIKDQAKKNIKDATASGEIMRLFKLKKKKHNWSTIIDANNAIGIRYRQDSKTTKRRGWILFYYEEVKVECSDPVETQLPVDDEEKSNEVAVTDALVAPVGSPELPPVVETSQQPAITCDSLKMVSTRLLELSRGQKERIKELFPYYAYCD